MFAFLRSAVATVLLLVPQFLVFADDAKPPATNPALSAADQLWQSGKFAEAEASYTALIKADPTLLPAQAGLVRTLLREDKVDEALETVTAALKSLGDLPPSPRRTRRCPISSGSSGRRGIFVFRR